MKSVLVLVFLLASVIYCGEYGKHGLRKARLEDMPKAMPPPEHEKTMFKFHTYEFRSNTTVIDGDKNRAIQHTHFIYNWDQVHNDAESGAMIRFALVKCLAGDCENVEVNKTYFLGIRQGRHSIRGLYKNKTDDWPEWSVLHSVVQLITLPHEEHGEAWFRGQSPHGDCAHRFIRKTDQRQAREIKDCHLSNHSLIPGLYAANYESEVEINLNKKYHGKVHLIRGNEKLEITSPLHKKTRWTIETEIRINLIAQNESYGIRFCNGTWDLPKCAEHMELDTVGTNWKEIMTKMRFPNHKVSIDKGLPFGGLLRMYDGVDVSSFTEVLSVVPPSKKNEHLQAFAAAGEIDLNLLEKSVKKEEFTIYLQALGHRKQNLRFAIDELKKFADSPTALSTIVSLCHRSGTCSNEELETFKLPTERNCKRALEEVCRQGVGEQLEIISKCDPAHFTAKDVRVLMNVFHGVCSKKVEEKWCVSILLLEPTGCFRQLKALDTLLRIYNRQPLAGTLLLRSEFEAPQKPTKWSYFHDAERVLLAKGSENWKQLRGFKVFQRNYNTHALHGNSTIKFWRFGDFELMQRALDKTEDLEVKWRGSELISLNQRKLRLLNVLYNDFGTFNLPISNLYANFPLIGGVPFGLQLQSVVTVEHRPQSLKLDFLMDGNVQFGVHQSQSTIGVETGVKIDNRRIEMDEVLLRQTNRLDGRGRDRQIRFPGCEKMKILFVFFLTSLALEVPEKFLGSWNLERTENIDNYMKERGLTFFQRKMVNIASVIRVYQRNGTEGYNTFILSTFKNVYWYNWTIGVTANRTYVDDKVYQITFDYSNGTFYEKHESGNTTDICEHTINNNGELVQRVQVNGVVGKRWFRKLVV
ncbi:Protein CBR-LBP-3 [Aphelenchoides besseyi]|nr:Protein CBR-LBP-3 [Aphelenchoides besseyi]